MFAMIDISLVIIVFVLVWPGLGVERSDEAVQSYNNICLAIIHYKSYKYTDIFS